MNPAAIETVLQPTAWALVHFLWQGALLAFAVAGTLTVLRGKSARLRYLVACGGLALMALLPVATAAYLGSSPAAATSFEPRAAAGRLESAEIPPAAGPSTLGLAVSTVPEGSFEIPWLRARVEPLMPFLVGAWLLGVAVLSLAHLGGWSRVRRLRRDTRPVPERWAAALERLAGRLGVAKTVQLLESARVRAPMVLGWLRPAILVPASAFTGLTPQQLEAVLAHELAHVRRHDFLVNLLQLVVETLLFYHPGVWWVSRQIRVERENCCDDLAVGLCGSPVAYARALAELEELRFGAPAFALGADGGSLIERIRRLVGRGDQKPAEGWLAVAVAALVATLVAALATALLFLASSSNAMPAPDAPEQDEAEQTFFDDERLAGPELEEGEAVELVLADPPGRAAAEPRPELAKPVLAAPVVWDAAEPEGELVLARAEPREDEAWDEDEEWEDEDDDGRWSRRRDDEWLEEKTEDLRRSAEGTPYERLTDSELRKLARYGLDDELIPALVDAGITDADAGDLKSMARYGVDGEDVLAYHRAGYTTSSTDDFIQLARYGVDADDVSEYEKAGLDLSVEDLVKLARYGVDGEDVGDYRRAGFDDLSTDDFIELAKYGVDGEDVRDFAEAGFTELSVEEMVKLARYGVDGEDVRDFAKAGYTGLTVDDLVKLARYGVDGEDVRDYREAGFETLSIDDLVELARHGASGEDVRDFAKAGFTDLSVEDMLKLSRHGVDGEDVRDFVDSGYTSLSIDDLINLSRYGVDGEDVRDFAKAGFTGLAVEELVTLARHGVDGEDARDYKQAGYDELTVDDMVELARQGVDGEDVAEYREAGYADLSVDDMIRLGRHGVDGDDAGEFAEAGFDLSVDELLELARHGVDGDDAAEVRDAGYADVTVDQLIDLASYGIDGDDLKELRQAGHDLSIEEVLRLARRGRLDDMMDDD